MLVSMHAMHIECMRHGMQCDACNLNHSFTHSCMHACMQTIQCIQKSVALVISTVTSVSELVLIVFIVIEIDLIKFRLFI